jgi:ribosomal-protein-alanine N-acetyltransferase
MLKAPNLNSARTSITILRSDRAELVQDYYFRNRDHLMPWEPLREESFYSLERWENRIEHSYRQYLDDTALFFTAMDPSETTMIAAASFVNLVEGPFKGCYLRFSVDKAYEGQGYMKEVLCETLNYMFCEVDLHRVMANYMPSNKRAAILLQKLGFEKEGLARSYLLINGKWEDHVLTSRLNPLHQ